MHVTLSQFTLIEAHQVCATASGASQPAKQPMTLERPRTNTRGRITILRFGLCHWIDWAPWAAVTLWSVPYHKTSVLCVSRTRTGKPLCYSRSCSTQHINSWPFYLFTCIPQEAVPFSVRSWVFISSHFFLIIVWLLFKIFNSDWKIFFIHLSKIYCRKPLKWFYLICFLGIFPP